MKDQITIAEQAEIERAVTATRVKMDQIQAEAALIAADRPKKEVQLDEVVRAERRSDEAAMRGNMRSSEAGGHGEPDGEVLSRSTPDPVPGVHEPAQRPLWSLYQPAAQVLPEPSAQRITKDQAVIGAYVKVIQAIAAVGTARAHLCAIIAVPDNKEELMPPEYKDPFATKVVDLVEPASGFLVGLTFFKDEEEAKAHATVVAFNNWYEQNPMQIEVRVPGREDPDAVSVSSGTMLDWLRENRHVVRSILRVLA